MHAHYLLKRETGRGKRIRIRVQYYMQVNTGLHNTYKMKESYRLLEFLQGFAQEIKRILQISCGLIL